MVCAGTKTSGPPPLPWSMKVIEAGSLVMAVAFQWQQI
jgi:hypothetical protein